nr:putative amino-acid permease c74.04 [Quercus suber]
MNSSKSQSEVVGDGHANRDQLTQDRDTVDLARTGKRQVLKVGLLTDRPSLPTMSTIAADMSCRYYVAKIRATQYDRFLVQYHDHLGGYACKSEFCSVTARYLDLMVVRELTCSLLCSGGPAGLVYQYLFAWAGTLAVFIAIGELSSMIPTAGGQYHWVNVLAPPRAQKLLSYITGWTTVISWMAAATAVSFFTGTLTQSIVNLDNPDYEGTRWQATLMMWGVLLLAVLVTTVLGRVLPLLEVLLLVLHILGFFGTMIPLVYHAHHGSDRTKEVFTTFFNNGSWPTQTLAFFIGLRGNAAAFAGKRYPSV